MSRFISVRPHRWHVQIAGRGPVILFLHGTGGASHSWRAILPALTDIATVVAPDLPGHGFTTLGTKSRSSLDFMSQDVAALCKELGAIPKVIVGHSAGAALAVQIAMNMPSPPFVIGINAALRQFEGVAAWLFPAAARGLASLPASAYGIAAALTANSAADRILSSTGSRIDSHGRLLYRRLMSDPDHVSGALTMMSQWSLGRLEREMATFEGDLHLLAGGSDRTVSPDVSRRAAAAVPGSDFTLMPKLGHLAHEEDPNLFVRILRQHIGVGR